MNISRIYEVGVQDMKYISLNIQHFASCFHATLSIILLKAKLSTNGSNRIEISYNTFVVFLRNSVAYSFSWYNIEDCNLILKRCIRYKRKQDLFLIIIISNWILVHKISFFVWVNFNYKSCTLYSYTYVYVLLLPYLILLLVL